MIDLIPKKLRNPDLKLIAYYSSVRYLEFMNMNDSRTGEVLKPQIESGSANQQCKVQKVTKTRGVMVIRTIQCTK